MTTEAKTTQMDTTRLISLVMLIMNLLLIVCTTAITMLVATFIVPKIVEVFSQMDSSFPQFAIRTISPFFMTRPEFIFAAVGLIIAALIAKEKYIKNSWLSLSINIGTTVICCSYIISYIFIQQALLYVIISGLAGKTM